MKKKWHDHYDCGTLYKESNNSFEIITQKKFFFFWSVLFFFFRSFPPLLIKNTASSYSSSMGFPFKFKRTPGTVFYWEKNDWSRKNGYRLPIDVYMIMQWVCLITLDLGFFCFLIHFLTVYENMHLPPILDATFENLNPSIIQANNAYINPYTTWACKISFS